MKKFIGFVVLCVLAGPLLADHHEKPTMALPDGDEQAMMEAVMKAGTPGEAHKQLAATAGSWKATIKSWMGPGEPMVNQADVVRVSLLEGRVVQETFEGDFMGMAFRGLGMTGFDNVTGKYWSTWNDNMSTGIMTATGEWDEDMKAIVFLGSASDPMTGKTKAIKTIAASIDSDHETMEMWEDHGGQMVKVMEISLVRD